MIYSSIPRVNLPFFSLVTFILIFSNVNSQPQSQLQDQEHGILLKIKQYLNNPPSISHWTQSNSSHCSWPEINCTGGSVIGLALVNASINQTIPPFICDLKNLTHVDFSFNNIPGDFPTSLYRCSKLDYLDLSHNNFDGKIPDDIDMLSNLQYLHLGSTNFGGDIPASIGKLKELRFLRLQYSNFNGTVPREIGNLSNLEFFDFSTNTMLPPWRLPPSWTKLNKLKVFYVYSCNLVGEIPETIGDMVALEKLDLSQNGLTGQIPSGLFLMKNLSNLYLWHNKLFGEIPSVVEALNLTAMDLNSNNLTGKIPDDFGKLQNLVSLVLALNNLSGVIPESLGRLQSLVDVRIFMNNFSEYVSTTRVSEKVDVFSFGVVLLELTTGKEANYGDEHSSLSEWAWRHFQLGSNIEDLLDKDVMEASYMDEMCSVFKLGVICTSLEPANRPYMKEVLQILLRFGEGFTFRERNVGQYEAVPLLKNSKKEKRYHSDSDSD